MRIIDCYYIKGYGTDSKCYKVHGVGIAYNTCRGLLYSKAIMVGAAYLAISPMTLAVGLGVGQTAVETGLNIIKNLK